MLPREYNSGLTVAQEMVAIPVLPRDATGNCSILRAELNTALECRRQALETGRPTNSPCHIVWLMELNVSQRRPREPTRTRNVSLFYEKTAEVPSQGVIIVAGDLDTLALQKTGTAVMVVSALVHVTLMAGRTERSVKDQVVANERKGNSCDFAHSVANGHDRRQPNAPKHERRKVDKQTWTWTDEIKKSPKKEEAKKAAKKAIAVARATHYDDVSGKLESYDGERFLYRLAKVCHRQIEDVEKFFGINDENRHLLMDRKMVLNRCRTYFEDVSAVEFVHPSIPSFPTVYGPVQKITIEEVEAALKKMKPGKAPMIWRPTYGSRNSGTQRSGWRRSSTRLLRRRKCPIFGREADDSDLERKGRPADCTNYTTIRLLSHNMKIFERIRDIAQLSTNQ
ncbi:unnamed protein product [Heligmosomoides polygyrus]|uniref:Uncharacterized protein n=1 Tax=Heligmosomoides polygyrus TaxID=6339 RepID=A0A183FYF8_HELPZ|nr:unnamed protein product [Heligmosomoides polygyrus]